MQKRKRHPFIASGIVVAIVALIIFIFAVRTFGWDWTGFTAGASKITITRTPTGTTTATELQPARTLWDWPGLLAALAIPVVVGLGAVWFTARHNNDRKIASDNQREAALQAYIDKISELLLHERLGESAGNPQVESITRARTVTVLRILDPARRGSLIQFLSQADILTKCIEDELVGIDLHGANLTRVNLSKIDLHETNLSGANLFLAHLNGAILYGADLSGADLSGADLSGAHLSRAILSGAILHGADLSRAHLSRAHLSRADLSDAKVAKEQLDTAKSLQGATMPDGSIHP